jgi:hypothetical protein
MGLSHGVVVVVVSSSMKFFSFVDECILSKEL